MLKFVESEILSLDQIHAIDDKEIEQSKKRLYKKILKKVTKSLSYKFSEKLLNLLGL